MLDYLGRERDVPPVVSPHNAYWFWREEAAGRDVVVSVDVHPEALERHFGAARRIARFTCEHCANWRGNMSIAVSSEPIRPVEQMLGEWRHFRSGPAPALSE